MTPLGRALLGDGRQFFALLHELGKTAPGDVDTIVGTLVTHLRSWRPESVAPLGALGPPSDPAAIRDPRTRPRRDQGA